MNLKTVLTPDTVNLHLKGATKEAIIDELLDLLVSAGKVKDKAAAKACVMDREKQSLDTAITPSLTSGILVIDTSAIF